MTTKVFHCTTQKKLKRYEQTGAILPAVRFWTTEYSARKWMKKTGRNILLSFDKPARCFPLPIKGGAAWTDNIVRSWREVNISSD